MKKTVLTLILLLAVLGASAQFGEPNKQIAFKVSEWDFGKIKEVDGPVSHTFSFTNVGKTPYVITNVSASCGCTTPQYSKAPVMPGKSGQIKVTFDPKDRPGFFNKMIYISSNGNKNMNTIVIKGSVEGRPRSIADDFPMLLREGIRASTSILSMEMVSQNESHTQVISLYNAGTNSVRLGVSLTHKNAYASVRVSPETLKPKERGQIIYTLDLTGVKNVWGTMDNSIVLTTNGVKYAYPLTVRAKVIDNFAQNLRGGSMDNAPKSFLTSQFHHFNNVKSTAVLTQDFKIKNEGNTDLVIHKIEVSNPKISYKIDKTTFKTGEEGLLKVTVKPTGEQGRFDEMVTLYLNDPLRPVREIRLMANVEK